MAAVLEEITEEVSHRKTAPTINPVQQLATTIYTALGLTSASRLATAAKLNEKESDYNVEDCIRHSLRSRRDLMPQLERLAHAVHTQESGALSPEQKLVCDAAIYFFPATEPGAARVSRTNALRANGVHL